MKPLSSKYLKHKYDAEIHWNKSNCTGKMVNMLQVEVKADNLLKLKFMLNKAKLNYFETHKKKYALILINTVKNISLCLKKQTSFSREK